jgi:hypothetical protein
MCVKIENSRKTGDIIIGRPNYLKDYLIDASKYPVLH